MKFKIGDKVKFLLHYGYWEFGTVSHLPRNPCGKYGIVVGSGDWLSFTQYYIWKDESLIQFSS